MNTKDVLGRVYTPRVIDVALERDLQAAGAVIIEGARGSGKTMTALNASESFVFLDDLGTQQIIEVAPRSLLSGQTPRLLDEWQLAPELWNLVRREVDARVDLGQFILTGSAVPADDATRHTGAGRFLKLRQRTMTWFEKFGAPNQSVSISALFDGHVPETNLSSAPDIDEVVNGLLTPGFPAMLNLTPNQSAHRLRSYIDDVARTDVTRLASIRHEPEVIKQLISALARSVATEVTFTTLAADLKTIAPSINPETVGNYVELLERLFIVEPQRPWTPALRSRARVRTSPKFHLVDPAFAAAALGAGTQHLLRDFNTFGLLFESSVIHDLNVFASAISGEVLHYRDSNKKEIDAIITLPDGRWGAVEVKLGAARIAEAVASLDAAIDQIDTEKNKEPSFKLIVTGTGPITITDNGTITAPLSSLAP